MREFKTNAARQVEKCQAYCNDPKLISYIRDIDDWVYDKYKTAGKELEWAKG